MITSSSSSSENSDAEKTGITRKKSSRAAHRILIVEDFVLTSNFLGNTLRVYRSAHCICAASASEALQLMEEDGPFDLVLTDVRMAGMDGIELIKQIRSKELRHLWKPQIIVCMSSDTENAEGAMQAGSTLFVSKHASPSPVKKVFELLDKMQEERNSSSPPSSKDSSNGRDDESFQTDSDIERRKTV